MNEATPSPAKAVQDALLAPVRALKTPDIPTRLTQLAVVAASSTPEAFAKLIAEEKALWARVIQRAGIKMK